MSIKESMLNIVSDLAQNDYIRAVTYGGYSRRVEVSELAKSVVEDYTGSSLAGENQSVQGAFSALENEIQNVEQDVAAEINDAILNILPTDTASGEIASFPDGSDLSPALSVVAGIEPVQDLHGYDAPWVVGAGKNKYPIEIGDETLVDNNGAAHSGNNGVLTINFAGATASGVYASAQSQLRSLINGQADTVYVSFDVVANGSYSIAFGTSSYKNETVSTTKKRVFYAVSANNTADFKIYQAVNMPSFTVNISNFMVSTSSDTTFAPYENICPISGHTEVDVVRAGKNLLNTALFDDGYFYTANEDGSITVSANDTRAFDISRSLYVKAGTYTISRSNTSGVCNIRDLTNNVAVGYMADGTASNTFTLTKDCHLGFRIGATASSYPFTVNVQLELGSTATEYEPYQGQSYTTQLGQTVYGGTLDVVSGLLTVTHQYISDFSNIAFGLNGRTTNYTEIYTAISPTKANGTDNVISNMLETGKYDYGGINGRSGNGNVYFLVPPSIETALEGKQWLIDNGVTICYELATPQTYQLTETQVVELFKGYNNVFSEAGDMSVTYKADIQLYIDKQTNELRVAILALS